ncbi:Transposase for insertion sequence element IS801 (plasmid) [Pseudomonas syringae pv. avii]|uniref:Transposase for insertion sequence element IS801 n=1 Tax=Pseudomonas syringae pv. avii TaxID=663959 RepID=A0ABY1UFS1_PSESX|nr:Transposase for insertion sequence element IS801 [Pseudomonas syringae pv. avii]
MSVWISVESVSGCRWTGCPDGHGIPKKTENGRKTVNYLGRYLKKPPISGCRLAHYTCGATLSFTYLDHRTQTYQQETLSQADMLRRVVQHIPEKHFRMIRYFGFLANRVCGQYLPKVYEALKMATPGPEQGSLRLQIVGF